MSAAPQLDQAKPRLATYEDLLAYTKEERVEILGGVVVAQASPTRAHGHVRGALASLLRAAFQERAGGPGGWWILGDVDVRLTAHDIVRPDLVGWRQERLPSPWGKRPIDVVPDWIGDMRPYLGTGSERGRKLRLYARHRVPHYWVVDPCGAVEAFELAQGRWAWDGHDRSEAVRLAPFDAIELPLAELFPPRREQVA